ncbi:HhH-GPD-type base excision DNA repair protein [Salinactinospora qingdaonensis]|uniref:HhH-GPD-type base excision DNA repair protein n=1 Tax=Salinactinospora qingdaonensis TaxID=702744 RepID=A0ABP7ET29_9ACTN
MTVPLHLAQDAEADELLARSPLALLTGMLLDQQIPMERAFAGPLLIARRLGRDDLDAHEIADQDPAVFAELLSRKPAVHRYPGAMAKRIQTLCAYIVRYYGGDPGAVWRDAPSGQELFRRLRALPGFGNQKSQIFVALLGKQLDVRPQGWRAAAGDYGAEDSLRSVADVRDPQTLAQVRAFKQGQKAKTKASLADSPGLADTGASG